MNDEVVVLDLTRPRTEAGGSENAPALDVDLFDRAGVEIRVWTQTSNWGDRVHEANAARNHFREHWLKDHIVLSVNQRELDSPTSEVMPKELFQGQRRVDPTETAPQDEDPCWSWAHGRESISVIRAISHFVLWKMNCHELIIISSLDLKVFFVFCDLASR